MTKSFRSFSVVLSLLGLRIIAADPASTSPVALSDYIVYGRNLDLLHEANAASDGQVGAADLAARPFLRRGELLETVPGVVVTQHSGSGKANQYFLRGFNLDHGTDFSVSVDGQPVNMRTHGHGQGYADLNFIIPEFVAGLTYQKGQYAVANGDFSAAGSVQFHLVDTLPQGIIRAEAGENRYARLVLGQTFHQPDQATTLGLEAATDDGPWLHPENSRRLNLLAKHTWPTGNGANAALTLLAYDGKWDATDQIPARAVADGSLDRFGTVDKTAGGTSRRASLGFDWNRRGAATTELNLHVIRYRLDLFSNFTYFLDDENAGDQFHQHDDRTVAGGHLIHRRDTTLAGQQLQWEAGIQTRADWIDVGLHRTSARQSVSTMRTDDVTELSAGVYARGTWQATQATRLTVGWRADAYHFDVASNNPLNSGRSDAALGSPKLSLIYAATARTEFYASAGLGFHSNDARGTTIRVDPSDGATPAESVNPLVRARSAELGLRTAVLPGLVSTLSLWMLDLDSELVFVGDAGGTEPTGATRRYGVEFANYYRPRPWLSLDADFSLTHARYGDEPAGADRIANSIATVVTAGASLDLPSSWRGALRIRYFGPQPLIEDNSVSAPSSITLNLRIGRRFGGWEVACDILNLLDRDNYDIAYFYASRLPGEASGGVDDLHFHPAEPRTIRFSITRRF